MQERYIELLKLKGLRNADVCRGTGISAATLSEWKKKKYELNIERIIAITNFLEVSLDYFVLGKEEQSNELLTIYNELNEEGKEQLLKRASELQKLGYIKNSKSGVVSA